MENSKALSAIPDGLRTPLLKEYSSIVHNYMERRWSPTELSGGRFCEIVYTIIDGIGKNNFASSPSKPQNIVDACKALENHTTLPRSLRILVPRLLPALYEIRNNRGVGHVGGNVDPNHMDSNMVLSMCNWIMAELVRVLHSLTTEEAQKLVDTLAELRIPLVWDGNGIKRVLDPNISIKNQVMVLIASNIGEVDVDQLMRWVDYSNKQYLTKLLAQLHRSRFIEYNRVKKTVLILPPGRQYVSEFLVKLEKFT